LINGLVDNQNDILKIKDLAKKIIEKLNILGLEITSIEPSDLKISSALDPSDNMIYNFMNNVDPSGDIPKYGTYRDLTEKQVRSIVKQCRAYQEREGTIEWYYNNLPSQVREQFRLETLKSWLKNPKFKPK
jgi:hypothetical protein